MKLIPLLSGVAMTFDPLYPADDFQLSGSLWWCEPVLHEIKAWLSAGKDAFFTVNVLFPYFPFKSSNVSCY